MTVWLPVECPHCHSTEVVKHGKSAVGKQRYRCQNENCPYRTFVLSQTYPGRTRQVLQQIVEMTLNGSGVRDIARVLHVSPTTVIQELKKTRTPHTCESETLAMARP
jgi:transposase-like protein